MNAYLGMVRQFLAESERVRLADARAEATRSVVVARCGGESKDEPPSRAPMKRYGSCPVEAARCFNPSERKAIEGVRNSEDGRVRAACGGGLRRAIWQQMARGWRQRTLGSPGDVGSRMFT